MRQAFAAASASGGTHPIRDLVVQADTLAFTLDLAATLLEKERPHLAALWREKAEAARATIRKAQEL